MFSKCLKLHLKLWVKENVLPPLFSRPSLPFLGQALEMFHKVLFATLTFLFNLKLSFLWPKCVNWPSKVHLMCRSLQLHRYFNAWIHISVHLQTSFISFQVHSEVCSSETQTLVVVLRLLFHFKVRVLSSSRPLVVHTQRYLMFVLHAISNNSSCLMRRDLFCRLQICYIRITARHRTGIWCRKWRDWEMKYTIFEGSAVLLLMTGFRAAGWKQNC